jgi:2-succinyl-6-hydroxy-2,4-cyclohexadiene-1-carboxylate synthase
LLSDKVRAIAVDLPGHGETPLPTRTGRDGFLETVDALVALLDELGVRSANLLGYSQGARFALAAAMSQPARFGSAHHGEWLAGAAPEAGADGAAREGREPGDVHPPAGRGGLRGPLGVAAHLRGPAQAVARAAGDPEGPAPSCTVEGLVGALECLGLGVQPDYWPELQRQRLPTLLLTGAVDDKFTQIARRMAAELPVVYRRTFEDCSHAPHLERQRSTRAR